MSSKNKLRWWLIPAFYAAVLACLFWRSFLPGFVHFNNDAPLGMLNSAWLQFPECMTGQWYDLNVIGANAGTSSPDIVSLIRWALGPVGCAKYVAAIALWILGICAWFFFRQLKLSPLAASLGALATMLSSSYFAGACWSVASVEIAIGFDFLALALVVASNNETPWHIRWTRLALAGLCVGINVMEGADVGALCSMFVAVFIIYKVLIEDVVPLVGIERVIILCCVNGAFLSLFVLGIVFGLGIFKLCLLLVFLLVAAFVLNWSLIRKLIPLAKTERIVALSLVNLAFLLLFICGIVHGFGFFPLALLLIVAVVLNWALFCYHLFVNRCGLGVIRLAVNRHFRGFHRHPDCCVARGQFQFKASPALDRTRKPRRNTGTGRRNGVCQKKKRSASLCRDCSATEWTRPINCRPSCRRPIKAEFIGAAWDAVRKLTVSSIAAGKAHRRQA